MTILVGTDGTGQSMAAVEWAAAEARRRDTGLRIVYAFDWDWRGYPDFVDMAHSLAEAVTTAAEDLARTTAPGLPVTSATTIGHAVPQLLDAARDAELLVVGNRGRGGFAGLMLGSVSHRMATHAPCPVVVVRGRETPDGPVIAGVDDSPAAGEVLDAAFDAAARRGGGLIVLRSGGAGPDDVLTPWRTKYPEVRVETVRTTTAAAEALVSGSHNAELVIVGSRGHGTIAGTLLGSVGLQLLHHADCPVQIVRDHLSRS
ncbi:universal stress protein [Paractinoplanes durhamensis]|nr:universal stress protein [Actinoplanes durhamensis]